MNKRGAKQPPVGLLLDFLLSITAVRKVFNKPGRT